MGKPFFRLVSLNFSPNMPDFDCKICLTSQKKWQFPSLKALHRNKSNVSTTTVMSNPIVSTLHSKQDFILHLSPNPATDFVALQISLEIDKIEIFDV